MQDKKIVEMVEFYQSKQPLSLKQQLVAAVACGDELAAEEIRMLLKMNPPEQLGKQKQQVA